MAGLFDWFQGGDLRLRDDWSDRNAVVNYTNRSSTLPINHPYVINAQRTPDISYAEDRGTLGSISIPYDQYPDRLGRAERVGLRDYHRRQIANASSGIPLFTYTPEDSVSEVAQTGQVNNVSVSNPSNQISNLYGQSGVTAAINSAPPVPATVIPNTAAPTSNTIVKPKQSVISPNSTKHAQQITTVNMQPRTPVVGVDKAVGEQAAIDYGKDHPQQSESLAARLAMPDQVGGKAWDDFIRDNRYNSQQVQATPYRTNTSLDNLYGYY